MNKNVCLTIQTIFILFSLLLVYLIIFVISDNLFAIYVIHHRLEYFSDTDQHMYRVYVCLVRIVSELPSSRFGIDN